MDIRNCVFRHTTAYSVISGGGKIDVQILGCQFQDLNVMNGLYFSEADIKVIHNTFQNYGC